MQKGLFYVLAFVAVGFMVAFAFTQAMWAGAGFFASGGLMAVLYPRQSAGDPADDTAASHSWMLPESQPARTIVMFIIGLVCLGIAAAVLLT